MPQWLHLPLVNIGDDSPPIRLIRITGSLRIVDVIVRNEYEPCIIPNQRRFTQADTLRIQCLAGDGVWNNKMHACELAYLLLAWLPKILEVFVFEH